MTTRWARVLRGTLAAAFATFVAAFSHTVAGGEAPAAGALALSFALSLLACTALAGRSLSLWRTALSVAFSQVLFHTMFSSLGSPVTMRMDMSAGAGHTEHLVTTATGHSAASHSPLMWAAHAAAAVITIIAIRYSELALSALRITASLLVGALRVSRVAVTHIPAIRPRRADWSRSALPRDLRVLFASLRHRGPPLVARLAPAR